MEKRMNLGVIMGGYSQEREISLKSGAQVIRHVDATRFKVYAIDISKEGWFCEVDSNRVAIDRADFSVTLHGEKISFDLIFNAIHGTPGEDGILQAYFDLLGIKYTGSNSYISALSFNKRDLLSVTSDLGIPRAKHLSLNKGQTLSSEEIEHMGFPCFVKANRSGSSFGVYKVKTEEELKQAILDVFEMNDELIIEEHLEGIEITVGVIPGENGPQVLPMTLIKTEHEFFDYQAKYLGESEEITPAPIDPSLEKRLTRYASKIYQDLGFKGATRSEFIIREGIPYLLEVNTTPGLTEQSILPQQARCADISEARLFDRLINDAL
ncbi:MAG: D-alanine--D-alanine ligase [Flavobacteriaceae bacterium]|nr:D-alanine--D-alanine ligase [Flavobacteriaceae bacterium]CAI8204490.1 MAG: D-alanine--D-alanine ligase [Flavobacteriaceae bacterium]